MPEWAVGPPLFSAIRSCQELSVVCSEDGVPPDVECERGFRALEVEGPLDFTLTGVLASITAPLAEVGVSIFAVSTHFTDYVLVKETQLERTVSALREQGHEVE